MVLEKKYHILLLLVGIMFVWGSLAVAEAASGGVRGLIQTAEAYNKQGNPLMAAKLYDRAIRMAPGNLDLYYRRAFMWGNAGYYSAAIKDFSFVINRERKNQRKKFPNAARFRGDCYMALGYWESAVNDYITVLRILPKYGKVWFYLAETYALMGRTDLALQAINKGVAATGTHWSKELKELQMKILQGEKIIPHKPLSN